ncbi:18142_t:CDS:1, partial [Gigaspora rosea]
RASVYSKLFSSSLFTLLIEYSVVFEVHHTDCMAEEAEFDRSDLDRKRI